MNDSLRRELAAMAQADLSAIAVWTQAWPRISSQLGTSEGDAQKMDPSIAPEIARLQEVQRSNVLRLREIVEAVGWPDSDVAGNEGAEAAWLILQHSRSPEDHEFRRRCLSLMETCLAKCTVTPRQFAMLSDDLALAEGRGRSYFLSGPLDNPDEAAVDAARARIGIPLLAVTVPLNTLNKQLREFLLQQEKDSFEVTLVMEIDRWAMPAPPGSPFGRWPLYGKSAQQVQDALVAEGVDPAKVLVGSELRSSRDPDTHSSVLRALIGMFRGTPGGSG